MTSNAAKWGTRLEAAVCEDCDWSFLLPPNSPPQRCPHCFNATLTAVEQPLDRLPYGHAPEMIIPPKISKEDAAVQIKHFATGIPFKPKDLKPANLICRLRPAYIPLWLVDAEVRAAWQAEVGFDYQVVSHRELYDQSRNGWKTQQFEETRVRWEPRLGRLRRTYHNQHAPALEDEAVMEKMLGKYKLSEAEPYRPELIAQSFIRLPNRPPQDAFPDAEAAFLQAGSADCQKAAEGEHIRDYRWTAEYHNLHWTQLLRSLYTTYYLDDNGRPQSVYINAQTGSINGSRRASMKRAQHSTLILVITALVLFMGGLAFAAVNSFLYAWGPILMASVLCFAFSAGAGLLALVPIPWVWSFNRNPNFRLQYRPYSPDQPPAINNHYQPLRKY